MRADQLLVERGLAATRSQAQRLIAAGVHWRLGPTAWLRVAKNGEDLPSSCELQLLDDAETRYVSRGGLKLEGALQQTGLQVGGWVCLDVGQSTGGFTDCLLHHGASYVTGVDVGLGQLHPHLRADPRVLCIEHCNARDLLRSPLISKQGFDLIVADVSFISLTLILPTLCPLLTTTGHMLLLVKPQFELQPSDIGKGGLVHDPAKYVQVQERLRSAAHTLELQVAHWLPSAITGGDGNHEFFIHLRRHA